MGHRCTLRHCVSHSVNLANKVKYTDIHYPSWLVRSWWVGLYEAVQPPVWPWFFHKDCTGNMPTTCVRFIRTCKYLVIQSNDTDSPSSEVYALLIRGLLTPAVSLVIMVLPIRPMLHGVESMEYGRIWWVPITAWFILWTRSVSHPLAIHCAPTANTYASF